MVSPSMYMCPYLWGQKAIEWLRKETFNMVLRLSPGIVVSIVAPIKIHYVFYMSIFVEIRFNLALNHFV